MSGEIEIRRIQPADVDETYDLIQRTFDTVNLKKVYEESAIGIWKDLYTKAYIRSCITRKHLYVAVLDGKIVGTAAVNEDEGKGYVSVVYVDPEIQGKGIGKKLMDAIDADEISRKTGVLYLHAALSATKFYKRMGYSYQDEPPVVIIDCGLDFIALEKKIYPTKV